MPQKTLLSWSSGKDSAWALHRLRQDPEVEVVGLFTTVNEAFDRVAMHAVRVELLRRQADAVGLPLEILMIPHPCPNERYEAVMAEFVRRVRRRGIAAIAFGDLFLADIRAYRERQLAGTGLTPLFPLWQIPTDRLAAAMLEAGLCAYLVCVDPTKVSAELAGRRFSNALLAELPAGVDPCGENGEFHTFAVAGPMFRHPVAVRPGAIVQRDGFVFADLLPEDSHPDG